MTDDQARGYMRALTRHDKGTPQVEAIQTITEILAVPVARTEGHHPLRDYREKVVAFLGSLPLSHVRYRATGEVIAEPRRQRASLLIHRLDRLQSNADGFAVTEDVRARFRGLQVPEDGSSDALEAADRHVKTLVHRITQLVTRIYGAHREVVLLGEVLVLHSLDTIPWEGCPIKGVIDGLIVGDTGQGKTTQARRLLEAVRLGCLASGSTSSRAGVLYSLDSKINDRRILRWGAFPLAHGEALFLDEAQSLPREEWREFTTARSEGVLRVDRSIRAEHPSRVRLMAFANPVSQQSMAAYQYGIMAVHPEQGFLDARDLRRFDFVACVAESDQSMDVVLGVPAGDEGISLLPPDLLRSSILWAWTRRLEHVRYAPGAEPAIRALAKRLNAVFGAPEIPLLITDAHEKVARLASAFAALLHSTDDAHELVFVTPVHVGLVGRFLEALYTHPNCAFDAYADVLRRRGVLADGEASVILDDLLVAGSNREDVQATEEMLELFLTEEEVTRADIEATTGLGKDAVSNRIRKLRKHRLIQSRRHGYRKTARFVALLRFWAEQRDPNPSNAPNPEPPGCPGGVS